MACSFCCVEEKVYETQFFFEKLRKSDFSEADFYFSAFVSAARSVTFALQSCMAGVEDFDEWYSEAQKGLKSDKLVTFFKELRNNVVHKGLNPINRVPLEVLHDFLLLSFQNKISDHQYLFVKVDKDSYNKIAVSNASEEYLKSLVGLIYACYLRFQNIIDPKWYFTEENFRQMGKTIEDALEESGFPSAWFDGLPAGAEAWRALRRDKPLCPLNPLFQLYLDRTIPDPDEVLK